MGTTKVIYHDDAERELLRLLAKGALYMGYAVELASKALTPVHGDPSAGGQFATRAPNVPPRGGTLRRSQGTAAYINGQRVGGDKVQKEKGGPLVDADWPEFANGPAKAVVVIVGTNVDYAAYVHNGTVNMRARPFLLTAWLQIKPRAGALVAEGMRLAKERGL